jgi:hypothetical protein
MHLGSVCKPPTQIWDLRKQWNMYKFEKRNNVPVSFTVTSSFSVKVIVKFTNWSARVHVFYFSAWLVSLGGGVLPVSRVDTKIHVWGGGTRYFLAGTENFLGNFVLCSHVRYAPTSDRTRQKFTDFHCVCRREFYDLSRQVRYIKGRPARPSGAELLTATLFTGGTWKSSLMLRCFASHLRRTS